MEGRLPERPLSPLKEELETKGIKFRYDSPNNLCVSGKLNCGNYTISGNVSSQYISGLLFALSILEGKSTLNITGEIESAPYIEMTVDSLKRFGAVIARSNNIFTITGKKLVSPKQLDVENDWSNAAFPLCTAALSGGNVTLNNVNFSSRQGDIKILELLEAFGAEVIKKENSVNVTSSHLHGIEINAEQIPDLVPALATVACGAEGITKIYGASRLRIKESDRLKTTYEMLLKLGAEIKPTEDGFIINGKKELSGGIVSAYNDHRIAMSAAIASSICKNKVTVIGAEATAKSYPDFWSDFSKLGFDIELQY
jgi:3-phosphoshikimate 1-carboxyvinyltransferase